MITIKQLADELGVTRQAVYIRMKKEPLHSRLENVEGAISTSAQGTIYFSQEGANIIRSVYAKKYRTPARLQEVRSQTCPTVVHNTIARIDSIAEQVAAIQQALATLLDKDAEIKTLSAKLEEKTSEVETLKTWAEDIRTQLHEEQNKEQKESPIDKDAEIKELYAKLEEKDAEAEALKKQTEHMHIQLNEEQKKSQTLSLRQPESTFTPCTCGRMLNVQFKSPRRG